MAVIYRPNSNAVLEDRAVISAQLPAIDNPDVAPFGGTIDGLAAETPNKFVQSLIVNGEAFNEQKLLTSGLPVDPLADTQDPLSAVVLAAYVNGAFGLQNPYPAT